MVGELEDESSEGGITRRVHRDEWVKAPFPETQSSTYGMAGDQRKLGIMEILGVQEVAIFSSDIINGCTDISLEGLWFTNKG